MIDITVKAFFLAVPKDKVDSVKETIDQVVESSTRQGFLVLKDRKAYEISLAPTQQPGYVRVCTTLNVRAYHPTNALWQANRVIREVNAQLIINGGEYLVNNTRLPQPAYGAAA